MLRTHTCGELTERNIGQKVTLYGWIDTLRDHGGLKFIDLRDRYGKTQLVAPAPSFPQGDFKAEDCIQVKGVVQRRPKGTENAKLSTGNIEVSIEEIPNPHHTHSAPLPFEVTKSRQTHEELRMKYRYLDLRNPEVQKNIFVRHRVYQIIRQVFDKHGFIEVETPLLTKSTPEGARDYLVPSRVHQGKFFALPQSPQQYKQLLMVAGLERYFQIAPCFRDEDARADRSPGEFYQIDMEMSFVEQEDVLKLTEDMFSSMVKKLFPEKHFTFESWPRLKHPDVLQQYGTDKPDLRKNKEDANELAFVWIVDFPLFTQQTKEDFFHGSGKSKWAPSHHMFTRPKEEDLPLLETDPGKVRSYQHDLVLNGLEVGGGSLRIHDPKVQEKVWDLIGFSQEQKKQFAHLIEAFSYGVPPHGGIAPGLDRLVSILCNEKNIREVIAFPLTGDVRDPLMGAPSEVSKQQLDELGIKLKP